MSKVFAIMAPKELTEEQKLGRITVCQGLLEKQMTFSALSMGLPIRP